ncbi:MAG: hypothetical protein Q8Q94_02765 [bacterium]|nr:hypothetical protein [bacterium]
MDALNVINGIVVSLGIPTIIGVAVYIGRKLQILEDLKDIRGRFNVVESKVGDLWADRLAPAKSPRQLNEMGNKILGESGIKGIVEEKRDDLLKIIREKNITNAYDAELAVMGVMKELPKHCPDIVEKLKDGAFKVGANPDTLLFVGGIYLRNLIFEDLGFALNDLDKAKDT